jgi:hypothetical protein
VKKRGRNYMNIRENIIMYVESYDTIILYLLDCYDKYNNKQKWFLT